MQRGIDTPDEQTGQNIILTWFWDNTCVTIVVNMYIDILSLISFRV